MMGSLLALTVLFAAPPVAAADRQAAIAFLRGLQLPSGGFVTRMPPRGTEPVPSLRTTRTGTRVLRLLGGKPARPDKVFDFLRACHDAQSGGFSDRPGVPPDAISTAVALMMLSEHGRPVEPYLQRGLKFMAERTKGFEQIRMVAAGLEELHARVPEADRWLAEIDRARNADGSFGHGPGQARTTALYVVAQQRLGGKPASSDAVLKLLKAAQRPDGGFPGPSGESDLEACYRIVRLLNRLHTQPDRPDQLRAFIARCRHADGGYGIRPADPSSLHGTYYAAILRHWLDG